MAIDFEKSLSEIVDDLATRVNLNGLSRITPERFHAEKSDIACDLRKLARYLANVPKPLPTTVWRSADFKGGRGRG